MSWYLSEKGIDIHSLELMFLYIKKCRKFSNTSINLNARYNFSFIYEKNSLIPHSLTITENQRYLTIFDKYKVNIKVICGKNGSGKTTIIELLQGKLRNNCYEYIEIYKDKNNNFLSTGKVVINFNKEVQNITSDGYWLDSPHHVMCANGAENSNDSLKIDKLIGFAYRENPDLFDLDEDKLFTHFIVDYWNLEDNTRIIYEHLREELLYLFPIEETKIFSQIDLKSLFKKYPMLYMLLYLMQDSSFDNFLKHKVSSLRIKSLKDLTTLIIKKEGEHYKDFLKLNKDILTLLYLEIPIQKEDLNTDKKNIFRSINKAEQHKWYIFSDYDLINEKINILSNSIDSFLKNYFLKCDERFHIQETSFKENFYIRPFKDFNGSQRFIQNLSSGELMDIWNKYSLLPCMVQTDGAWFFEDEPDKHLHPEWKRQLLSKYLNAIDKTRKFLIKNKHDKLYKEKLYSIIFTTHSPFLLSDLPKEHIVFLDTNSNGITVVREDVKNTFAGNIGAMFYDNFFMSGTIGEFSKKIIENILKEMEMPISLDKKYEIEKVFGSVGDVLLKKLLLERLEQAKVINEENSNL